MSRDIRLHYERVVGAALVLAAILPLYFLLTGFAAPGRHDAPVSCGSTVTALGRDRSSPTDPAGACHAGAVDRLHLAASYFAAAAAVALCAWTFGGLRERWLNGAWERGHAPSRWMTTPSQVWIYSGLLFVVLISITRSGF
jgi:hypothetical protein